MKKILLFVCLLLPGLAGAQLSTVISGARTYVNNNITTNGVGAITGAKANAAFIGTLNGLSYIDTSRRFGAGGDLVTVERLLDSLVAVRQSIIAGGGGGSYPTFTAPSGFTVTGSGTGSISLTAPGNASTQYINGAGGASLVSNLPVSTATQAALDGKAAASHTHTLSQLAQSGATSGQQPQWNGSAWVPVTPTGGTSYTAGTGINISGDNVISSTVTAADGSETKISAGTNVTVTGSGTTGSPYVINASGGGGAFYDSTLMASTKRLIDTAAAIRAGFPAASYPTLSVPSGFGVTGSGTSAIALTAPGTSDELFQGNGTRTTKLGLPISTATQTALDGKAATSHTHAQSAVTGLADSLLDIRAFAATGLAGKAAASHTHTQSNVTGLADSLLSVRAAIGDALGNYLNLREYGLVPDDTSSAARTANTAAFIDAFEDAIALGGGRVMVPGWRLYVNPIVFPGVEFGNATGLPAVEFFGENFPQMLFGTIGSMAPDGLPALGTVIECHSTTPGGAIMTVGPSVSGFSNFSYVHLILSRIELRAYDDPQISGLNALKAQQLTLRDVVICTGVYNPDAVTPTNPNVVALIAPGKGNAALTAISDCAFVGFYHGITVEEHMNGNGIRIATAAKGILLKECDHGVNLGMVDAMNCVRFLEVDGPATINIAQLNFEFRTSGTWQTTEYMIYDPYNRGRGRIQWTATEYGMIGGTTDIDIFGGRGFDIVSLGATARMKEVIGDVSASDPVLVALIERLAARGILLDETSQGVSRLKDDNGEYTIPYIMSQDVSTTGWVNTKRVWTNANVPAYAKAIPTPNSQIAYGPVDGWAALQYKDTDANGAALQLHSGGFQMGFSFDASGEVMYLNNTTETGTGTMATVGAWYRLAYDSGSGDWTIDESTNDGGSWSTIHTFGGTWPTGGYQVWWWSGVKTGTAGTVYYPQGTW